MMNKLKLWCITRKKWVLPALALVAGLGSVALLSVTAPAQTTAAEPLSETEITFDLEANKAYSANDGVIVIPTSEVAETEKPLNQSAAVISDSAGQIWVDSEIPESTGYTLPERTQMADGSIGVLSIPKLGLTVNVFETQNEMEAMTKGIAHFKTTSAWDGNVGLCGHNQNFDLTDGYFKNIHKLSEGDTLHYKTALGERSYTVTTIKEIAASDWGDLGRTEDNRLTLITCISGKSDSRLVVQAVEKE